MMTSFTAMKGMLCITTCYILCFLFQSSIMEPQINLYKVFSLFGLDEHFFKMRKYTDTRARVISKWNYESSKSKL